MNCFACVPLVKEEGLAPFPYQPVGTNALRLEAVHFGSRSSLLAFTLSRIILTAPHISCICTNSKREKSRYTFIYTYTGQRPSMLVVAIGIVLGSTTARILLGGPRGPGSKAWIKRCDYHKSRGDPVALSSHQVATSSPSAHSTTKVLAALQEKIRHPRPSSPAQRRRTPPRCCR